MKVLKIDKQLFEAGIDKLTGSFRLSGPVKDQGFHLFKPLGKGQYPDLSFQNTRLSAKALIYPQSQPMFDYSLDDADEDAHLMKPIASDDKPQAVIGIRPCDADAFQLVKRNFDTADYKDPYWLEAFEKTTLVGLACDQPCQTCFCTTAGSGPYHAENLDLMLVDGGDHYLAQVISDKGRTLAAAAGWNTDAGDAAAQIESGRQKAAENIVAKIATDRLSETSAMELYNAPFWEDVAFACINCGTCTYLCPTCWCFDIQDETHGKSGQRMRNWDSCMFPLFSLHGSGHNPRSEKVQRVRQRFMHKLKYYVDKYEAGIMCVGCGRCVTHCPVNIDIRRVAELMNSIGSEPKVCAA